MQRLQLDYHASADGARHSFDVPDIATALVVADINLSHGVAMATGSSPHWRSAAALAAPRIGR